MFPLTKRLQLLGEFVSQIHCLFYLNSKYATACDQTFVTFSDQKYFPDYEN